MAPSPVDNTSFAVAWRETGAGPPVLFLHGLGGTRTSWGPQLRGLHHHFRCLAWDMPGYGHSEPVEPLTFEAIADRLVLLLDHLQLEQVDLVGLSFGGMHALHTALRHPTRVRRLALADTSPAFGLDGTTRHDWMASRLVSIDGGRTLADAAEAIVDAITVVALDDELRNETLAAFGQIPATGFRAAVSCLPTHDIRHRLAEIAHPACVIVGEHDEETPVSYARLLADGLTNSELHIIDGVGHLTPAEAPDRFNQLVANFLTN